MITCKFEYKEYCSYYANGECKNNKPCKYSKKEEKKEYYITFTHAGKEYESYQSGSSAKEAVEKVRGSWAELGYPDIKIDEVYEEVSRSEWDER